MEDKEIKVNINKLSFYSRTAIIGAAFSVFCLIYNINFIYYGFITFVYGVISHLTKLAFYGEFKKDDVPKENNIKKYSFHFYIIQFILVTLWLLVAFSIYR